MGKSSRRDTIEVTMLAGGNFCRFGNIDKWASALPQSIARAPSPIHDADEINVVGRNGTNFAGGWISRQYGCQLFCLNPRWRDTSPGQKNFHRWKECTASEGMPDVLAGTARSVKECAAFIETMQEWKPIALFLATISEIVPIENSDSSRSQHLWIDSATIGGVMGECGTFLFQRTNPLGV